MLKIILAIFSIFVISNSYSASYKCSDSEGKTIYQQTACSSNQQEGSFDINLKNKKNYSDKDFSMINQAINKASNNLKDPTSAIFSELRVFNGDVCGKVLAKNSYGAFTGNKKFISFSQDFGRERLFVMDTDGSWVFKIITRLINCLIYH